MGPKPLRAHTRKTAGALPQTARFNFLLDGAKLLAGQLPVLAQHLGQQALQVCEQWYCV